MMTRDYKTFDRVITYPYETNAFKGASSKKKTDLVEMIVYGCITDKINKMGL